MIDDLLKLSSLGIYIHAASVSITLGFPIMIGITLWKLYKKKDERFLQEAKILTAILAINFALGGVTGTLVEFGLVQIWPGTIFAIESFAFAPLTLELIAFISEVVFLIFFIVTLGKWNPKRSMAILAIYWIFALLSGALITSVNSWMQSPQGTGPVASAIYPFMPSYGQVSVDVRKLVSLKLTLLSTKEPLSLILQQPYFANNTGIILENPYSAFTGIYFTASILHNLTAAVIVGLSLAASGYSYRYFKTKDSHYVELLKPSFLVLFVLMLIQPTIFGHLMGTAVVDNQPTKFASMEGANTTYVNPLMGLLAYGDPNHPIIGYDQLYQSCRIYGNMTFLDLAKAIGINQSQLTALNVSSEIMNMKIENVCLADLNSAEANIETIHYSYYTKISTGILALLSSALLALTYYRIKGLSWLSNKLTRNGSAKMIFIYATLLFVSASTTSILGWFVREVGRKPWTVYGLLYPQDVVTPVQLSYSPGFLAFASLVIIFVAILGYAAMFIVATRPSILKRINSSRGGS
ncbi:MAG: cytochrome ubiquinol oxidase subunit I [Fervidicoccaceae archaeon]